MKTNNHWMILFPDKICPAFFSSDQVLGYETCNELKQTTFIDDKIFTKISSGIQTGLLIRKSVICSSGYACTNHNFHGKFLVQSFAKNGG